MQKNKKELTCGVFLNKKARRGYLDWLIDNGMSPDLAILLTDYEIGDTITIFKKSFLDRILGGRYRKVLFNKFNLSTSATDIDVEFIEKHCGYKHYNEVHQLLKTLND